MKTIITKYGIYTNSGGCLVYRHPKTYYATVHKLRTLHTPQVYVMQLDLYVASHKTTPHYIHIYNIISRHLPLSLLVSICIYIRVHTKTTRTLTISFRCVYTRLGIASCHDTYILVHLTLQSILAVQINIEIMIYFFFTIFFFISVFAVFSFDVLSVFVPYVYILLQKEYV